MQISSQETKLTLKTKQNHKYKKYITSPPCKPICCTKHGISSLHWLQTTQPTRGGAVTAVWQTLCKLCRPLPITVFWASWPCGPAGWLAMLLIKAGDVETNPGPTTTRKQVWICDICHRLIQVRKQISIRCNRIEHWVHLRCTRIRLAQYTDT